MPKSDAARAIAGSTSGPLIVVAFLADENFNNVILRGLLRKAPHVDVVRVQDVGLEGADDPEVLQWAVERGRVLVTHDVATMPMFAAARIERGLPMAGLCVATRRLSIANVIEELLLVAECSELSDWDRQIVYLPL